ncbi:hypothetical protein C6502_20890 [Candidatus Poribacteria bacterium]|nr:MAG: hypothetical protein C6502_20890 [Candidatus Poribacteria bacterium]
MRIGFGKFQIMLILQGVLFAGLTIADAAVENNIERSFQVTPGGRLTVDSDRGSIEVRAADRDQVDVKIERKVKRGRKWSVEEVLEDLPITFDHSDGGVTIRAKYGEKNSWPWNRERNRLGVKFLITVPQRYNVDLKTLGGGISVADLAGEVRSQTSGGSLRIGSIKGPVWGRTSGGSIKLEGTQGDADVKTSGGKITIGSVAGAVQAKTSGGSISIDKATGGVNAKTSGGSITVEEVMGSINAKTSGGSIKAYISRQPEGDCSLETSGGSVTAYLVEDIGVDVEARTSGGSVSTDVPIATVVQGKVRKNRLQGAINGGGPLLKLRTSGGSIRLRKKPIVESQHENEKTR